MSHIVAYDLHRRPHYAYGVYHAALQAKSLHLEAVSVIEFGVAGGTGLVALEEIANRVSREVGIKISVYGFDTGEGLPTVSDYRDLPYVWQGGRFAMDVPKLKSRLTSAELVLGNVQDTVGQFLNREDVSPIGFVAFDLDLYTSTKDALKLFSSEALKRYLPRTILYFDDIIGGDVSMHCEYVGELLAIEEFNSEHSLRKICPINGLRHKRVYPKPWNDQMYAGHFFDHSLYNTYINHNNDPLSLT